jgi:3-deoxy-manno-octulosonate cytidylyltransferase (CMP-KDO synthetase)
MTPRAHPSNTTSGGAVSSERLRALAILPARLASTRLVRKMMLDATGTALIVHSARNVIESGVFARVVVAADAQEIVDVVRASGIEAVLTRADHPSGTDRVHECFAALRSTGESARIVVGVQGDEPELEAADLARLVAAFETDASVEMATLAAPVTDPLLLAQSSIVKVVCDARGDALYFSRAPIPFRGHGAEDAPSVARRHVGVYAFTPDALARFCGLPRGLLEVHESLEQLRWLEHGRKLRVVDVARAPAGIDTQADYEAFVVRARARAAANSADRAQGNSGAPSQARSRSSGEDGGANPRMPRAGQSTVVGLRARTGAG